MPWCVPTVKYPETLQTSGSGGRSGKSTMTMVFTIRMDKSLLMKYITTWTQKLPLPLDPLVGCLVYNPVEKT